MPTEVTDDINVVFNKKRESNRSSGCPFYFIFAYIQERALKRRGPGAFQCLVSTWTVCAVASYRAYHIYKFPASTQLQWAPEGGPPEPCVPQHTIDQTWFILCE